MTIHAEVAYQTFFIIFIHGQTQNGAAWEFNFLGGVQCVFIEIVVAGRAIETVGWVLINADTLLNVEG
jgi:hypothetical protein